MGREDPLATVGLWMLCAALAYFSCGCAHVPPRENHSCRERGGTWVKEGFCRPPGYVVQYGRPR